MTHTRTYLIFSPHSVFVAMFMLAFFFVPGVFAHAAGSATLSASPDTIFLGGQATVTWNSSGTFKCIGDKFNTNGATSGTATVKPSSTGTQTYSVLCYVTSPACTLQQTQSFVDDGPGLNNCSNITAPNGGCYPNGAQCMTSTPVKRGVTWKITQYQCTGSCTTVSASDTVTVNSAPPPTQPFVDLSASPATVTEGGSTLISWNSSGASSCDGTGFSTGGATRGSVTVTPTKNTSYSILCYGTTFTSTPGEWRYAYTDHTDLWCSQNNRSYSNVYTENECPSNDPTGQSCTGSEFCAVNHWRTAQGVNNETLYCTLVSDVYRCNGGSTPKTYSDSVSVAYNRKPSVPTITGPVSGTSGANHTFVLKASDPDGDKIRYRIDWDGNGSVDESSGYVNSNTTWNATRSWSSAGTYTFKARAQDNRGAQSSWRSHTITIGSPTPPPVGGGSCSGSPSPASTGEPVTWAYTPSSGEACFSYECAVTEQKSPNAIFGNPDQCQQTEPGPAGCDYGGYFKPVCQVDSCTFAYSWSGDERLSGSTQSISKTYATAGTKNASVTITSGGTPTTVSCSSVEVEWQCSDGLDNDGDDKKDAEDPGCWIVNPPQPPTPNPNDPTEFPNPKVPECRDGIDNNDNDLTDYPDDLACSSADDDDEGAPPPAGVSLLVDRWLIISGQSVTLTWSAENVKKDSCTVSDTNKQSWGPYSVGNGRVSSSPLTSQTVFTLSCKDFNDNAVSDSKTVRLVPWYREF